MFWIELWPGLFCCAVHLWMCLNNNKLVRDVFPSRREDLFKSSSRGCFQPSSCLLFILEAYCGFWQISHGVGYTGEFSERKEDEGSFLEWEAWIQISMDCRWLLWDEFKYSFLRIIYLVQKEDKSWSAEPQTWHTTTGNLSSCTLKVMAW